MDFTKLTSDTHLVSQAYVYVYINTYVYVTSRSYRRYPLCLYSLCGLYILNDLLRLRLLYKKFDSFNVRKKLSFFLNNFCYFFLGYF